MNGKLRRFSARSWIAFLIVGVYVGVPVLCFVTLMVGGLQFADLKALMGEWHKYFTPLAMLVIGYYFNPPQTVAGPEVSHRMP